MMVPMASVLCLLVLLAHGASAARLPAALSKGMNALDVAADEADDDAPEPEDDLDNQGWMLQAATEPDFCTKKRFRNNTLKLVREKPLVALLHDTHNHTKFEASGLVFLNQSFYVIFDNLRTVARIDHKLGDFSDGHLSTLIEENKGDRKEESQFEGITYVAPRDSFLLLRESLRHPDHGKLNPVIEEVRLSTEECPHEYTKVNKCFIDFELESDNKGFESLHYFQGPDGADYTLGLCESNFCRRNGGRDAPGLQRGNGRIVLATFQKETADTPCKWAVVKGINVPASAYLLDYAGLGFGADENGQADVAIASQEDSAVWIGRWDWQALDFASQDGIIWHLPRDNHCGKVYCNIEGVQFMDKTRLALASDRCKGTQPFTCHAKDQALHVFALAA